MNASKLKGKTIAKVHQSLCNVKTSGRSPEWVISGIEFTDGTWLRFVAVDTDDLPEVRGIYPARPVDAPR